MKKCYWPKRDVLVCLQESPTPDFWNRVWRKKQIRKEVQTGGFDRLVIPETKKYLPPGSRVLEGGCGTGKYVYSLIKEGYKALGIDTAKETISKVKRIFPKLPVRVGTINQLPFSDRYFSGYWSIGVIEHFFNGFEKAAAEMARVIRPGGFLFLTFPYLSPLRKMKIFFHRYPVKNFSAKPNNFYQFLLSPDRVRTVIEKYHFKQIKSRPFDGFKGAKDELHFPKQLGSVKGQIRLLISGLSLPFASHSILLVFRKT